jgi:hypothetical protein
MLKVGIFGPFRVDFLRGYRIMHVRKGDRRVGWIKEKLKGSDLIIGCSQERNVAMAARSLGIPYLSGRALTTFLPEGIRYEEVEVPRRKMETKTFLILAREVEKLRDGRLPVLAPRALSPEGKIIRLKLKCEKGKKL